jgi:tetratricopeptide (TPR) repeat protein
MNARMPYYSFSIRVRSILVFIGVFLLVGTEFTLAQADHQLLKNADQAYIKQDFNKAEESYRKALEKKQSETTKYNLGNAIMEQNRPDEAITYYEDATKKPNLPDLNAKAWYNLGNAYYQKKEYDKSVKAYKESLKQKPGDVDTKKNLVLAKKQLIKQQQQQQQQQQNKDQQNKDQKQDQQQQPNKDQQQQQQQQPKDKQPQDQQQNQPQDQKMTKEEAEQLLQYSEREDQRVQQKLVNKNSKKNPPKKDW